jgi:hypothetical protein
MRSDGSELREITEGETLGRDEQIEQVIALG